MAMQLKTEWKHLLLFIFCFSTSLFSQDPKDAQQTDNKDISISSNINLQEFSTEFTGNIKINGRQLLVLVDGIWQPFIMHGVCYNPVRKGATFPDGLVTLNPTEEELELVIEKDFKMMEDAGINTIRTYYPITNNAVLDLAVKHHLRIIVPLLLNYFMPLNEVDETIAKLKDHPSTLIWEVGNEWNINYLYTRDSSHPDGVGFDKAKKRVQKFINRVKMQDTTHPVSTCVNGIPNTDHSSKVVWDSLKLKHVDIYGVNIYDGLSFGPRFKQWKKFMDEKPLYIAEFGGCAFNAINGKDQYSQAEVINSLAQEIQDNLSAYDLNNTLIGGCVFEWNDEWWKGEPKEHPELHDTGGILCIWDNTDGTKSGPYPDHIFHERWFGITDIDRHPRAAYFKIKELWFTPMQSLFFNNTTP